MTPSLYPGDWKCLSLCLQATSSFLSIFRFHLGVISYDTRLSLSASIHLEWSSLLSFLWPNLTLFPSSWLLRNIVLCTRTPLSVSIHSSVLQLTWFSVLAVVHSGAGIAGWLISLIILVVSTWLSQCHPIQTWDTVCSDSRDGIASQEREFAGNKLGIAFFLFLFLMPIPCWSIVDL